MITILSNLCFAPSDIQITQIKQETSKLKIAYSDTWKGLYIVDPHSPVL